MPGTFTLVDHAIFRAFHKGTIGILSVTGPAQPDIFAGQTAFSDYTPEQ